MRDINSTVLEKARSLALSWYCAVPALCSAKQIEHCIALEQKATDTATTREAVRAWYDALVAMLGKEVCEVYHPGNDIGLVREYAKETGIEDAARA